MQTIPGCVCSCCLLDAGDVEELHFLLSISVVSVSFVILIPGIGIELLARAGWSLFHYSQGNGSAKLLYGHDFSGWVSLDGKSVWCVPSEKPVPSTLLLPRL